MNNLNQALLSVAKKRVDENIINNSKEYYRVLFRTVLTLLEEELAFTKFAVLVTL